MTNSVMVFHLLEALVDELSDRIAKYTRATGMVYV